MDHIGAIVTGLALIAIAVCTRQLERSWLFPPTLFCLVWGGVLISTAALRYGDLRVTSPALLIFLLGALVLTVSSACTFAIANDRVRVAAPLTPAQLSFATRAILVFNLGLVVVIPSFAGTLARAASDLGIENLAAGARLALGGYSDLVVIPHWYQSVATLGAVLACFAAWMYDGTRRGRWILGLSLPGPFIMAGLTFARSPVIALAIGVLTILAIRRTVRFAAIGTATMLAVGVAVGMGAILEKGPSSVGGESFLHAVAQNVGLYFTGGILGFSAILDQPYSVGEPGLMTLGFVQLANWFGAGLPIPHNILGYVSEDVGNVYTAYFGYWADGGWTGVCLYAACVGVFSTFLYIRARRGYPIAGVAFGTCVFGLIFSTTADQFFGSFIPWIIVAVVVGGLTSLPMFLKPGRVVTDLVHTPAS